MSFFTEIKSLPHQFPHGLRVLIVDHDTTTLNSILEMCIRCNYQVSTCSNASFALNLLNATKDLYDVILIEAQMHDMDSSHFMEHVTQQIKIPVIMMCADESTSLVMKAIEDGACGVWIKPLHEGQIKNMWQHVVRKALQEKKHHDQVPEILNEKGLKKRKRDDHKSRLSWSQELHQQFLCAVNQLGIDEAKPKKIMELMDVPGLRSEQIASHLQKLRLHFKRSTEVTHVGKRKSKWDEYEFQGSTVQNNVPDEVMDYEVSDDIPTLCEAWSLSGVDVFDWIELKEAFQ